MRQSLLVLAGFLCFAVPSRGQKIPDYLPAAVKYDPAVPTPEKYLGFPIGRRHLQHHELVGYLRELARTVPGRVSIQEYGRSHGDRPLLVLTITAPENHKRLEEIRREHLKLANPKESASIKTAELPAVIWMGYGVHGNEPSASNAAPLVAYHLAAGTGENHARLLRELVVLLDPCLNPDGLERFARWANDNRGKTINADPQHREHREAWPGGRTNYYWFDLNRDWLPAQHPESQGRLGLYHRWKPNLVLDFHEMESNSTYFFQPGVPRRNHPLIPAGNLLLSRALAKYHARALDALGSLYFSEERFDDFYPGKGSTYPDLHGGVGILFEQAGVRGQVIDTPNGRLTFPFTIRNQFQTSLSSLRGLQQMREQFLGYKRDFYRESAELAGKSAVKGYVVAAPGDPARLHHFLTLLHHHDLRAYRLEADRVEKGQTFRRGEAYVIPAEQAEFRFLQALFEMRTSFADKVFYDVSAWTLPLAYNLTWAPLARLSREQLGTAFAPGPVPKFSLQTSNDDLAYLIDWRGHHAPAVLYRLLAAGVKVRVAALPFKVRVNGSVLSFAPGTLAIPLGIQASKRATVHRLLQAAAQEGVAIYPLRTGQTEEGINLGSNDFLPVPVPRILLVTGEGVNAYEAGEVWHLLDQRLGMPLTLADGHRLGTIELEGYSAIVLVSGTYANVSAAGVDKLQQYVARGGTLISLGTSMEWLNSRKIAVVPLRESRKGKSERRAYANMADDAAAQLIRGAIFQTSIDPTHPVCFGFAGDSLPVCRTNRLVLEPSENAYSSPVIYTDRPLLAGYVSKENLERLSGSAGVVIVPSGRGRVILMADNPNFRAFWHGTSRLFSNALFFGPLVRVRVGN